MASTAIAVPIAALRPSMDVSFRSGRRRVAQVGRG